MTDKQALAGKRLLFLGSTPNIASMVRIARGLGVYTIVTDNKKLENAPAKQIADEYASVSLADIEAVAELIREKHIDGVLTGFSDSYLQYYEAVCERAGLPCYGNGRAFGIGTNKMLFKQACEEMQVGTIPGVSSTSFNEIAAFAQRTGYPLMLKPVDNSGSRGVIKCERAEELRSAYEYALSFSATGNVICERFMDCDGISVSYQLIDGEAYLSSVCDRSNYYSAEGGSSITGDLVYPSEYTARYVAEMDEPVKRMLAANGFRHGMVSLQSFVDDAGFYMCEMCYRPSGGNHYLVINDQNGIDSMELLIEFAVTGHVEGYDPQRETPFFHDYCAMAQIEGRQTEIVAKAEGVEAVRSLPGVIAVTQTLREGEKVGKAGTTASVLVKVWFKAPQVKGLQEMYDRINALLCFENAAGESLIVEREFCELKRNLFA